MSFRLEMTDVKELKELLELKKDNSISNSCHICGNTNITTTDLLQIVGMDGYNYNFKETYCSNCYTSTRYKI